MNRRIALISEHASPLATLGGVDSGGQNVYVGQLARNLTTLGYEVDIFTRRDNAMLPEQVEWAPGVRVVHVPAGPPSFVRKEELLPHMAAFTQWLIRWCGRQRRPYELVHANFWMSGLVAADLKKALDLPFVMTFHALGRVRRQHQKDADGFPDERMAIEDRIVAEADHVIAECPQDEEDLIRLYNADPQKVTIIPCGCDRSEFTPMSKELVRVALGLATDERVVLQLGRLVPRKGVDNAIRGVARLNREHGVATRLLVVGGDTPEPDPVATPEIARLQAVANDEGIADRVTFVGRRGRELLKYYYSAADVFITTPWYEPFGITPLEAMACGTPVVGSNVGGIKFTVRDGETGYLVPPNDPDALAERLAHLFRHPKLLAVFRRQAIRRANDLFTWEKVAQAMAALYEDVLASRQPERFAVAQQLAVVDAGFDGLHAALTAAQRRLREGLVEAADAVATSMLEGGKLLACGNGGSAADAQHLATELAGRYRRAERPGLPAIALTADGTYLTAWANDAGFDDVFARQVQALGRPGDVLVAFSTSGRSPNVVRALEMARAQGLRTVAFLGGRGGDALDLAQVPLVVPSDDTQRIQEIHGLLLHLLCDLVEERIVTARRTGEAAVWPRTIWEPARRRTITPKRGRRAPVAVMDASTIGGASLGRSGTGRTMPVSPAARPSTTQLTSGPLSPTPLTPAPLAPTPLERRPVGDGSAHTERER
jgi:D-inositol-3-phosphate glycosyltransferase